MAERMLRRGLPRVKGGEPWPPAVSVEVTDDAGTTPGAPAVAAEPAAAPAVETVTTADVVETPAEAVAAAPAASGRSAPAAAAAGSSGAAAGSPGAGATLRRGLPRVAGGEPWPPVTTPAAAPAAAPAAVPAASAPAASAPTGETAAVAAAASVPAAVPAASATPASFVTEGASLRRGLPRVAGGEPWPPAGAARVVVPPSETAPAQAAPVQEAAADAVPQTAVAVASGPDVSSPLAFPRTVWAGAAPRHATEPEREPSKLRPTWPQAISGLLGLAGLGLLAVAGVFFVRALLTLPFMQDFLAAFPGEYHPAVEVEPGFAPWVGWQHFFNMFLMVLIIRSGLRVRSEKRPTVFWTPRGNGKGKISLTLWFHQALDLLWIINGVVFVVLLVVTGHWARIVPTSWEVFPNALSAALQYISFDWPTDNGWVNYNSLQQLAYFATVFIAAPLAVITGFRMSGLWPKKAEKLSKAYPIEWARAVHFPVMLYFVAFIIVHVALVMLTGMLRNLNHMFAAQGSVDGAEYAANWTGFWVFVLAILAIVGAWFAARPLVLAPIAKLFGQVSGR